LEIENFQSTGIYFQHLGKLRQENGKTSIVIHIELVELEEKISEIGNLISHIRDKCLNELRQCRDLKDKTRAELSVIKNKYSIVVQLLGGEQIRFKRGLINAIGSGMKILFGTMDNSDAEYYQNALLTIKENEEYIQTSMREEIKVVRAINEQNQILKTSTMQYKDKIS